MRHKFFLLFIILPLFVSAQNYILDLTLQQSSSMLVERNNSIKIADYSLKAAKEEKTKLNSFWYPSFNAVGAFVHSSNSIRVEQSLKPLTEPLKDLITSAYPGDQVIAGILQEIGNQNLIVPLFKRNVTSVDANIIWPLFTGGKRIYTSRIANRMVDISKIEKNQVTAETKTELVKTYYGLRLAKRVVDVRLETYNTLQLHYQNALKLEENGMLNKADRLFAQVAMDEAKREYESSRKSLIVAQKALTTLLNIDSSKVINPTTALFINDEIPTKMYFKELLKIGNYFLDLLSHQEDLAKNQIKINKSNYAPTISFVGKQNIYARNLPKNLVPRTMLGLDFTWNIFDGLNREAGVKKAILNRKMIQTAQTKTQNDFFLAVDELYSKMQDAQDNVSALNTTIKMSKELLRVRRKSFLEGMATSTDVVDAETLLSKVQISYLMAYYQYDVSLASLLSVCGVPEDFHKYKQSGKSEDFIFK